MSLGRRPGRAYQGYRKGNRVKKNLLAIWAVVVLILLPYDVLAVSNGPSEEIFFKANEAFKEGHFQEAIKGYDSLVQSGLINGHLYFNLGNAYYRTGQLGRAILNFEKARLLMPRDADLRFNLDHVRGQTVDAITESKGFVSMVFFWLDALNLGELFWAFAVANIVLWTTLLLRIFYRLEWTYYSALATVAVWIVLGTSFGMKWQETKNSDRVVILAEEVPILAGPNTGDTVLFKLHEGAIVRYERSEDDWSLIRLSDKKRGWVKTDTIENIALHSKISISQQPPA